METVTTASAVQQKEVSSTRLNEPNPSVVVAALAQADEEEEEDFNYDDEEFDDPEDDYKEDDYEEDDYKDHEKSGSDENTKNTSNVDYLDEEPGIDLEVIDGNKKINTEDLAGSISMDESGISGALGSISDCGTSGAIVKKKKKKGVSFSAELTQTKIIATYDHYASYEHDDIDIGDEWSRSIHTIVDSIVDIYPTDPTDINPIGIADNTVQLTTVEQVHNAISKINASDSLDNTSVETDSDYMLSSPPATMAYMATVEAGKGVGGIGGIGVIGGIDGVGEKADVTAQPPVKPLVKVPVNPPVIRDTSETTTTTNDLIAATSDLGLEGLFLNDLPTGSPPSEGEDPWRALSPLSPSQSRAVSPSPLSPSQRALSSLSSPSSPSSPSSCRSPPPSPLRKRQPFNHDGAIEGSATTLTATVCAPKVLPYTPYSIPYISYHAT